MSKKLTMKEMQEIAKSRGGECISKEYINERTKIKWKCKDGHIWKATPTNVKRGTWCPYCVGHAKDTIEGMRELAKSKEGICLSEEYLGTHTKLKWRCKEGHVWEATPHSVKQGKWCSKCSAIKRGKQLRMTIQEMQEIAEKKGGKCLSTEYVNGFTKLRWQCKEGHIWEARPVSIKRGGWCPYCAHKVRLTIEQMHEIAKMRGGRCLSTEYIDLNTKLIWQCKEGHVWESNPANVWSGSWCPFCSSGLSERIARKYFELIFHEKFPKVHPGWLKNEKGNKLELDGYCEKLRLAFEYQGEQHYSTRFYGENPNYQKIQRHDKMKRELCEQNNVKLITIPYTVEHREMQNFIIDECKKKNVSLPEEIHYIDYNSLDVYSKEELKLLQSIAENMGGLCLSEKYTDSITKMKWQCKVGHIWEARSANIKQGHWCPYCAGMVKLTIKDMQKLAGKKGGKCLSNEYKGNKIKLKWQCKEGHIWEAKPNAILYYWCPHCAGVAKLTIEDMQKLAESKGGKCLSEEYNGNKFKLTWRCKEGHVWEAHPNAVKTGHWCPVCAGNAKLTLRDMQNLAAYKKGKCLSSIYVNSKTKLKWQCIKGHVFWMIPNCVQQGQWCPKCAHNRK